MRTVRVTLAAVASLVLAFLASTTRAQCPTPASVSLEQNVCSVRLSWAVPTPGQVASVTIRRGTTSNFSDSVVVGSVSPIIPFYVDTPPTSSVDFRYWVVFVSANIQCPLAISMSVSGRPYSSGATVPRPISVSSTCDSVVSIVGQSFSDATSYRLLRGDLNDSSLRAIAGPQPTPVFLDTTASTGGPYLYAVSPTGSCGSASFFFPVLHNVSGPPAVTAAPAASVEYGGIANIIFRLSVGENGGTYVLLRNGVQIAGPSQAPLSSITFPVLRSTYADAGTYVLRVTTPCGTADSSPFVLAVRQKPCEVDVNDSGGRDIDDIFIFLNRWFAGCP